MWAFAVAAAGYVVADMEAVVADMEAVAAVEEEEPTVAAEVAVLVVAAVDLHLTKWPGAAPRSRYCSCWRCLRPRCRHCFRQRTEGSWQRSCHHCCFAPCCR